MSRIHVEFSNPETGIDNLSVTFDDLPPLTAEQRDVVWIAIGNLMRTLVDEGFGEPASTPSRAIRQ